MRRFRLEHWLKTSLWVVPVLFILGGIALSLITTSIDDGGMIPESVTGDTTAAMQILYLIAFAMLTLTGLVLSLLVLVVQLAMGSFSPRIVRQILQDRPSQVALGLFAGTFSHALLSMRAIKTTPDGGTVPGLAVLIAIVLVLTCIATLVWYLNHIGQSLRAAALVGWVARDTMRTLDRVYPGSGTTADPDPGFVSSPNGGVIFTIAHDRLTLLATKADCQFELLWAVGDFVPTGASLVRVIGDPSSVSHRAVSRAIVTGPERTMNQDVAYGMRMLVDIAEHSLSSGPLDDPTTAVQSIDRIHDILRQIAQRPLHDGRYEDRDGTLRLTVPTMHWDGYVRIAFDEIRQAGAGSPQVIRRLRAALEDLLTVALPERRAALERQLTLLTQAAAAAAVSDADRRAMLVADPSGIGSADELTMSHPTRDAQGSAAR